MITVDDVSVNFDGRDVLSHVSLCINTGDFVAISGPNGGGKTTLMRVMLRLLKPSSGRVVYDRNGSCVRNLAIGYLPQKSSIDLKFPITVEQTVRSGLQMSPWGRFPKDSDERFLNVVELTGIGDYLRKPVGVLSGGQLQRTLMARALVANPEILMLDEPLSYVDKNFERQIYSIMENLASKITIVLVSHEMSVIAGMANRHLIVDHTLRECSAHVHYHPHDCE